MRCLYCKKEIGENDKKRMVAFDKPYANLFVHLECLKPLDDYDVSKFANDNGDWFNQLVEEFGGTQPQPKAVKTKTVQVRRSRPKNKQKRENNDEN